VKEGEIFRGITAVTLMCLSLACWVVLPAFNAFDCFDDASAFYAVDLEEDRGEENNQGEEEVADDEVKKDSPTNEKGRSHFAVCKRAKWTVGQSIWNVPDGKGVFEPPEVKA